MAIRYSETVRHNQLDEVKAAIDAGSAGGKLLIYTGSLPGTFGASSGTLLATITFSATSFGTASSGAITANDFTVESSATAGTAGYFRVTDSDDTAVLEGTCGESGSGADLIMGDTAISSGATVDITSFVLTGGNA